ncbi:MAG: 2-C-methyl-D-erythritol 4-phosphate cytidylyltransferase [Bacteroidetes bacterium]|nr:2-C-methyl-D-erythritol 4-phosphate cytidylyltransferase [Bacteroidota bacterium]MBS1932255.1 2-C-methyl-D-erythritol 4-phosphate cytidylyltransferase [Bacteroidota bacterium]
MQKYAVIVAGGSGIRMGGEVPKQFQLLKDKPVLWHTLHAFIDAYDDVQIILVLPENHVERGREIASQFPTHRIRITTGGETRFQSVKNGLRLVDSHSLVFVHDGVRCLVTPQLIRRCGEAALEKDNAIPAVAAIETVRIQTNDGNMPIDRNKVRVIQTPQTFFSNVIKQAFEQPYEESFTDEASVVEKMGVKINLIEGERINIKITTPIDLVVAAKILEQKK